MARVQPRWTFWTGYVQRQEHKTLDGKFLVNSGYLRFLVESSKKNPLPLRLQASAGLHNRAALTVPNDPPDPVAVVTPEAEHHTSSSSSNSLTELTSGTDDEGSNVAKRIKITTGLVPMARNR